MKDTIRAKANKACLRANELICEQRILPGTPLHSDCTRAFLALQRGDDEAAYHLASKIVKFMTGQAP